MDRQLIYPGAIPLETDLLSAQKNDMVGLSKLAAAVLGTTTQVNGLACNPNAPAALNVVISPGEIYSLQNIDSTAYSSIAADTVHQIVKQGILLDALTLATPAPATGGQSINYLIQATYQDFDAAQVVLPYYNASNPTQAYSGPNNAGTTNNTVRKGTCVVAAKTGISATTGTQLTPAPDAGYVGLFVVTVANGQTSVLSGNISTLAGAPFLTPAVQGRLLNIQVFNASGTYTPTAGTKSVIVEVQGGGGGGGGTAATGAGQTAAAPGGSAGGFAKSRITSGFAGAGVTVGAAGAAGAIGGPGGGGGTSSFGVLVSATGGVGGGGVAAAAPPYIQGGALAGATPTSGNLFNASGGYGGNALSIQATSQVAGPGGTSFFGAGPQGIATATGPGSPATSPGAGGSGGGALVSAAGQTGGTGAAGIVIVWELA